MEMKQLDKYPTPGAKGGNAVFQQTDNFSNVLFYSGFRQRRNMVALYKSKNKSKIKFDTSIQSGQLLTTSPLAFFNTVHLY